MDRIVESEIMDDAGQALAYARADFEEPNAAYVRELEHRFPDLPARLDGIDLGCGPGDIMVRLAAAHPQWHLLGVDGSGPMLEHAARAIESARVGRRVRIRQAILPASGLGDRTYDLVLSNSLLHHLPDPDVLWTAVAQLARDGAAILIVDLARPPSLEAARSVVETYSAAESAILKRDFFNSLCAAFTVAEVREQLTRRGLGCLQVEMASDRHLRVAGRWRSVRD